MGRIRLNRDISEILEKRSRLPNQCLEYSDYAANSRIEKLMRLLNNYDDSEINRHVIVSSIAALQTFHRGIIAQIIDYDDKYKERISSQYKENLSIDIVLRLIQKNEKLTFGELIANALPCNHVVDLISIFNVLLSSEKYRFDVKNAISEAVNPSDRRQNVENPRKLIRNIDQLIQNIEETFQYRHIFAHEAAPEISIDKDTCKKLLESINDWLKAIHSILWNEVYIKVPLTSMEMIEDECEAWKLEKKGLAHILKELKGISHRRGDFRKIKNNHFEWEKGVNEIIQYGMEEDASYCLIRRVGRLATTYRDRKILYEDLVQIFHL